MVCAGADFSLGFGEIALEIKICLCLAHDSLKPGTRLGHYRGSIQEGIFKHDISPVKLIFAGTTQKTSRGTVPVRIEGIRQTAKRGNCD